MCSRFTMYVDPTEEGIPAGSTLDDVGADPTDEVVQDSETNEMSKLSKWRSVTSMM
jgi:hypothetical protein